MEKPSYVIVLVTAPSPDEAQKIARLLLEKRRAACVNIVPGVDSLFHWQGKLESARETLMIVKTKAALLDEVVKIVKSAHSYTCPEVIALPIVGGNPEYMDWIDKETK